MNAQRRQRKKKRAAERSEADFSHSLLSKVFSSVEGDQKKSFLLLLELIFVLISFVNRRKLPFRDKSSEITCLHEASTQSKATSLITPNFLIGIVSSLMLFLFHSKLQCHVYTYMRLQREIRLQFELHFMRNRKKKITFCM